MRIGKVNGTIVWESHAILRYLAARYGRGKFWSDDPAERSESDRWMDWSQTTLQPDFLIGVFWGFYRTQTGNETGQLSAIKLHGAPSTFNCWTRC
jgi:glutathione S-transferase